MNENANMMKCPSCEKLISKKAAACPECGHGFNSGSINIGDPVHLVGVILAGVLLLGLVVWFVQVVF